MVVVPVIMAAVIMAAVLMVAVIMGMGMAAARQRPQHPGTDGGDQRIAGGFQVAGGVPHRQPGDVEQRGQHTDQQHRREALHQGSQKGEQDAAPHRAFVGQQVGRDHRLAVARPDGVKDAVDQGDRHQGESGDGTAGPVHRAHGGGQAAVQVALDLVRPPEGLLPQPAGDGGRRITARRHQRRLCRGRAGQGKAERQAERKRQAKTKNGGKAPQRRHKAHGATAHWATAHGTTAHWGAPAASQTRAMVVA